MSLSLKKIRPLVSLAPRVYLAIMEALGPNTPTGEKDSPVVSSTTAEESLSGPSAGGQDAAPTEAQEPSVACSDEPSGSKEDSGGDHRSRPSLHLHTTTLTPHPASAQPWHPQPATPFSPPVQVTTSLEDLYNERTYLMHNLKRQGERATHLLERYAALEAARISTPAPQSQSQPQQSSRKMRKEAAMLKSRISESNRQGQLMLLRLGEIWLEVRNRERWLAVVNHRLTAQPLHQPHHHHDQHWHQHQHPIRTGTMGGYDGDASSSATPTPITAVSDYHSCASALSPLSPIFMPKTAFASGDAWAKMAAASSPQPSSGSLKPDTIKEKGNSDSIGPEKQPDLGKDKEAVRASLGASSSEDGDDEADQGTTCAVFDDVLWEFDCKEEGDDTDGAGEGMKKLPRKGRQSISINKPFSLSARDKRMSLPSLKAIWPQQRGDAPTVEEDVKEDARPSES